MSAPSPVAPSSFLNPPRAYPRRALGLACQSKGMPAGSRGALEYAAARWAAGMRAAAAYEVRTAATSALTEGQEVRNTVVWLSGVDGDGG